MTASECCFYLVLLVQHFTSSLSARIASMVDKNQSSLLLEIINAEKHLHSDVYVHVCSQYFLHIFGNEFACSLTNEINFSSNKSTAVINIFSKY